MAERISNWKEDLRTIAAAAKAEILGIEKIVYRQHAHLIKTTIAAFGADPAALIFVETLPASQCFPRPDLILVHPSLGVVVIECKGVEIGEILNVEGHALTVNRKGGLVQEDPYFQAERVMYALKDLIKTKTDHTQVLFSRMVALPAIDQNEFENRFSVTWGTDAMFRGEFGAPEVFRRHVESFCRSEREKSKRPVFLTRRAGDLVAQILKGRATLHSGRNWEVDTDDQQLLGVQIHALESTLKSLTAQQTELMKTDVRGQHRLYRGVAGSGKSLLLAALLARLIVRTEEDCTSLFSSVPPRIRVLAVCFNRTLAHHLRGKIDEEYRRLAWHRDTAEFPAQVHHFHGLLREMAAVSPSLRWTQPYDIDTDRKRHALFCIDAFNRLDPAVAERLRFDAIFVDEAQDLEAEEIQLLLQFARRDLKGNQTFVLFYDNAQNIYGVPSPVWESLGVNIVGRTTYMDQCMRNTREIVELAFNVLVGAFAPPQVRVTTRQFADVATLRNRGLVVESDDRFEVSFANRRGPAPEVRIFSTGREEREFALQTIRSLWREHKVLPSDILILYPSHVEFDLMKSAAVDLLAEQYAVRSVDRANDAEKNLPLIQDRTMTFCTIHSAKGYDAPVVILMGADLFSNDSEGRAAFYVAATRAKLKLFVFGVKSVHRPAKLLDEIAAAWRSFNPDVRL